MPAPKPLPSFFGLLYANSCKSAVPTVYYAIFALYEPFLCIAGLVGAFVDPVKTHNMNGPWPLAHTCALLGIINFFVLTAIRELRSPALQEKIAASLFTPLLVSDVSHILVTLYGIGDTRWNVDEWPSIVWITIITGFTLLIPRVCWHLGIGRYVDSRDAWINEKN